MATLKNLTINDTGYFRLPQGTTAQRPTTPTITPVATFRSLAVAHDGLQLWICSPALSGPPASFTWQTYTALPTYLQGLLTTTGINETDGANIVLSNTTKVYMLRVPTWNTVDTTGWTTVETGQKYISGETNVSVFTKTFTAGTYSFDNNSAMYLFDVRAADTTIPVGSMRFNTTTNSSEFYDGSTWRTFSGSVQSATGGTQSGAKASGGFNVHTFTSPGTFTPQYSGTVEVLVVAGGGGGSGLGGGGGGGGFIYNGSYTVTGGTGYAITVGSGGSGATNHTNNTHTSGGDSNFGSAQGITATGGGRGYGYSGNVGSPGGSGGGGSGGSGGHSTYGVKLAGTGIIGQGHPGGWGHHHYGPAGGPTSQVYPQPSICVYGGGGGGGAGEQGFNRQGLYYEAKGGDGASSTISGTAVTYYAAGGAGGNHGPGGNYARDQAGRSLGGGGGSYSGGPQAWMDASGHGSGGGAAHHPDTYRSGNGSAGIVIVRYRTS